MREMKQITKLEQYSELLNKYHEQYPDLIYNRMMLPGEAEHNIGLGKLYYREVKDGVVFSVREKDFCKLYCYLSENAAPDFPEQDRPQIIECIYLRGKEDLRVMKMKEKTAAFGFRQYVKNQRRRAAIREEDLIPLETGRIREDLLWTYASEKDLSAVYGLWKVMDIYNSTIPEKKELKEMAASGELLTVRKSGRVCGVVRVKQENRRTGSMWLMAVDREFRRQGIATELYRLSLSVLKERGCTRVIEWCDEKNHAILKVSGRFDFQPDGTVSESFIRR